MLLWSYSCGWFWRNYLIIILVFESLLAECFSHLYIDNLNGSIDEPVEDGDTALHLACLYGHLPCVQVKKKKFHFCQSVLNLLCVPYLSVVHRFLEFLKLKLVCLCSYFWKEALAWKLRMKMGQFLFMMLVLGVEWFPNMHLQQFSMNFSGLVIILVYLWYLSF